MINSSLTDCHSVVSKYMHTQLLTPRAACWCCFSFPGAKSKSPHSPFLDCFTCLAEDNSPSFAAFLSLLMWLLPVYHTVLSLLDCSTSSADSEQHQLNWMLSLAVATATEERH